MVKFLPLALLASIVTAVIVAAPRPVREGLVSHDGAGKEYVVARIPALEGGPYITARLRVEYVVAGLPGETYTVELWLGRTGDDRIQRFHFDTQQLTVPGETGGKLREVTGRFDRSYYDRDPKHDEIRRYEPKKPGEYSLFRVDRGKSWDCRLVVKKNGMVVSDSRYFQAVLHPVVEI